LGKLGVPPGVLRPFYREIITAGYLTRDDDGVLGLTERGQAEVAKVADAIGRITLRMVREADAEARRAGYPGASRAVQAAGETA
jgi:hypothetical protein